MSELCPHFMRVPRGYRRNVVSPMKGIDTLNNEQEQKNYAVVEM